MLKYEETKPLKTICAFREEDIKSFENFSPFNPKISHIDVNFESKSWIFSDSSVTQCKPDVTET